MSYTFDIPPELQVLWQAGKLVRRGALLINSEGGGIVAHLQETGGLAALQGLGGSLNPLGLVSSVVSAGASVASVAQNEQIKNRISVMQETLASMQGMQVAALAGSVASLGVSAAGTAIMLQRMKQLREDVASVKNEVIAFREEWRADDLEKLLTRAQNKVERVQSANSRKDATPLLNEADAALDEAFDSMNNRIYLLYKQPVISLTTLRLLLDGMAMTGAANIKALFLLDEPMAAKGLAQRQFDKFAALTTQMPADRLIGRVGPQPDAIAQITNTVSAVSEARLRIGGLPSLVDHLMRDNTSTSRYLADAEAEQNAPLLILRSSKSDVS